MKRVVSQHRFIVQAPVQRAFMWFTPAGETLWVEGWAPRYLHPEDGRTEPGMVFTTGEGDEATLWTLVDFDRPQHRARYVRCTPASRVAVVEVACGAIDDERTEVAVRYTVTALSAAAEHTLAAYEGERFTAMIDGWASRIAACLPTLWRAEIP